MDNVHILIMQNIDEYWICILLLMSFAYAYTLTHTWVYTVHGYHTHDTVRWWHCLTKAPESAQRDSLSRVFRPSNSQIPIPQNARSLHFQLHEYLNHLNPEGDSLSHVECAAAIIKPRTCRTLNWVCSSLAKWLDKCLFSLNSTYEALEMLFTKQKK